MASREVPGRLSPAPHRTAEPSYAPRFGRAKPTKDPSPDSTPRSDAVAGGTGAGRRFGRRLVGVCLSGVDFVRDRRDSGLPRSAAMASARAHFQAKPCR